MKKYLGLTIIAILAALLMLGGTGCSTSKTTTQSNTTTATNNTVNIVNFTFTPETLTVKVGTTVTWTNNDSTTHRPVSDTGVFDSGDLPPGAAFSFTFNNTGTYSYHCSIHPYMTGKVIVQ